MNRRSMLAAGVAVVGLCFAAAVVRSDDAPKDSASGHGEMTPEQHKEMEMWMKLSSPGAEHERMMKHVGTWNCEVKVWHGPGEPEVSPGKSVMTSILSGRYVEEKFTGNAMGGPFEGRGIFGYDNGLKKYVATWIDTMSTKIMTYEGEYDEGSKALTMRSTVIAPDGSKLHFRGVTTDVSDDKMVFEMYRSGPDGEEAKELEITYTRA
ncbi:MAG: DUF1579 domain-containing protein [Phycisphaerales bacterium]|nr:DUF1579 domain-containing protein [Phycisphaerales bacterium]